MAATFSTSCIVTEISSNAGLKEIMISTPNSGESGDIVKLTLTDYGFSCSGLIGVTGWVHTAPNSIVATEPPTVLTSASGVITVTSGTGAGKKVYLILGKSN